ncbi:MAG: U32 family peptidase, partial [Anaerococcus sp.]|nr:U32 family peptidase [Anaerococcus sp.]
MNKTEILAPVGKADMLYAGLAAGADSFYLALDDFGARAYAENFTLENIKETIDYIHLFGKRVFITMNTLMKDYEMTKAISYVEKLYEYGVDGLIIQDLGFFSIIKDQVPAMQLHASTQMAVREYYGAKYLADLGFDRIVIARETPIEEIRKIVKLPVETEVFVHGSLCVSFSGECLMSSYFGGRSANRGRCAGPCRQKYKLISDGKVLGDDYYLNMKDLSVIDNLDELLDIGVDCLKIEGRMKTPEYVFAAVANYKSKIEENTYNKNQILDSSNRGYTKGFIFGQQRNYITLKDDNKHRSVGKVSSTEGKKYFISNSDLYLGDNLEITTDKGKKLPFTTTRDYKVNEKIFLEKYPDAAIDSDVLIVNSNKVSEEKDMALKTYRNLPIKIDFKAYLGENPQITLTYKDASVTYTHAVTIEAAKNISLTAEDIRENLEKFNDEIFTPTRINMDIDQGIFLRKKDINECRRMGVALLEEEILKTYHRDKIKIDLPQIETDQNHKAERNVELLIN